MFCPREKGKITCPPKINSNIFKIKSKFSFIFRLREKPCYKQYREKPSAAHHNPAISHLFPIAHPTIIIIIILFSFPNPMRLPKI